VCSRRAKNRRALACSAPFCWSDFATGGSGGNTTEFQVNRGAVYTKLLTHPNSGVQNAQQIFNIIAATAAQFPVSGTIDSTASQAVTINFSGSTGLHFTSFPFTVVLQ
jgi:hypothetical protein